MSEFEYLLFIVSLLLGFAIARLIGGIPHAFDASRRYWIHAAWVVAVIANVLLSWWLVFMYREVAWTFFLFALWLVPTAMLLYSAQILVPDGADDIQSWRAHFQTVRKRLMGASMLFAGSVVAFNFASLPDPAPGDFLGPIPGGIVFYVGYMFDNERVQGAVVLLTLAIVLTLMFQFNHR